MFIRIKTISHVGAAVIIIIITVSLHAGFPIYLLEPLHGAAPDSRKLTRNENRSGGHAIEDTKISKWIPKC